MPYLCVCVYIYYILYICTNWIRRKEKGRVMKRYIEIRPAAFCWHCWHQRPYAQWQTCVGHQKESKGQRCILGCNGVSTICRKHKVRNPPFWNTEIKPKTKTEILYFCCLLMYVYVKRINESACSTMMLGVTKRMNLKFLIYNNGRWDFSSCLPYVE